MSKFVVSSLSDVKKILEREDFVVFGLGGLPSTRSEIWKIAPYFEVITLNRTGEFDAVKEKMPISFFPKDGIKEKIVKKPGELLSNEEVREYIKRKAGKKRVGIYVYKTDTAIERACRDNGWLLIANPYSVFQKVSSKKFFFQALSAINFNRSHELLSFSDLEKKIDDVFARFGNIVVIQLLNEGGGRGTFFFNIKQKKNIEKTIKTRLSLINYPSRLEDIELVISPFISGPVLSTVGCVTRTNGVLSSYAQYQLIDIVEVTGQKKDAQGVFCGHDWSLSSNIPLNIHAQAQELTKKIGKELKQSGHIGIFGVDFILDEKNGTLFPLEINPRILGSFPTIVYTQYQKGEVPLIAFHLLDFLNIDYRISEKGVYQKGPERSGAHIILFNPTKTGVVCENSLKGGVYKVIDGEATFLRLGLDLSDFSDDKEEFIITEGVPVSGKVYEKNRKLLKIIASGPIASDKGRELNDFGKKIVKATYKKLMLKPVPVQNHISIAQ